MNMKPLINTLLLAGIALFIAGCGKEAPLEAQKEKVTDGQAPTALPSVLKVKRLAKTYVITGIGLGGSNKVAIINNQVVKPGMEIDPGVTLQDIQPTYAIILVGNTQHLLRPEDIQREMDKKRGLPAQ